MTVEKELPEPSLAGEAAPYWEAAKEEVLKIQRCEECEEHVFPPRCACPYCLSPALAWTEASGRGTVYTYSTVHHPPNAAWDDDVPYTLAIVHLEEDAYLFTELVNCAPDDVALELPVTVTFDHLTPDVTLPKFEPAE